MKISFSTFIVFHSLAAATIAEGKDDGIHVPNLIDVEKGSPVVLVDITEKGSTDIHEVDQKRRRAKKVKKAKSEKAKSEKVKSEKAKSDKKPYHLVPCKIQYEQFYIYLEGEFNLPISSVPTASGSLKMYHELNEWAIKSFHLARGSATAPAFTSFKKHGIDEQKVMCSVVNSVFNSIYPGSPKPKVFDTNHANYFKQSNRDDCNIAATAFAHSREEPHLMISLLAQVYWQGIISTEVPKPRKRALDLDWNPSICARNTGGSSSCQGPAMFMYSVAMRDAMNVQILKGDESPENYSYIAPVPISPKGSSYMALSRDMKVWTTWLGMKAPSIIQGDCKNSMECKNLLDGMLPYEIAVMSSWYGGYVSWKENGSVGKPPPYTDKRFPRVTALSKKVDIIYSKFFTPLSIADPTALLYVCKQSKGRPVYIGINSCILPDGAGNFNGLSYPDRCINSGCGESHCVQTHWVVMLTDFCGDNLIIWSWGQTWTLSYDRLANATTAIMYGF